jgi:hypothetical protein
MTPRISAAQGICSDKPFSERKLQHLSDDEVGAIVRYLHAAVASSRGALRMAPDCIAADIELRARKFLREKEREQRARHPSKIARDLDTGLGRVRRCLEDLQALGPGSDRRALKRAAGRAEKLLRWLDDLDQDLRDALFIETIIDDAGRPVEDPPTIGPIIAALWGLDHPHTLAAADRARLDRATLALNSPLMKAWFEPRGW